MGRTGPEYLILAAFFTISLGSHKIGIQAFTSERFILLANYQGRSVT